MLPSSELALEKEKELPSLFENISWLFDNELTPTQEKYVLLNVSNAVRALISDVFSRPERTQQIRALNGEIMREMFESLGII